MTTRYIFILALFLALVHADSVHAQQISRMVLSAAGRDAGTSAIGVSWTLGQIETAGLRSINGADTVRATLGFHQAFRNLPKPSSTISIDRVAGKPGEHVFPMVRLTREEDEVVLPFGPDRVRIQLTYNPTILYLNGAGSNVAVTKNEIQGDIALLEIQVGVQQLLKEQILAELDFTAALGNREKCALDIISVTPEERNIGVNIVDGEFTLLGLCVAGGVRLLDVGGRMAIESVAPHPVRNSSTIVFETSESALTTLSMYDLNGRKVRVLLDAVVAPSRYELSLSIGEVADGWYELVLSAGAYTIRKPILISR